MERLNCCFPWKLGPNCICGCLLSNGSFAGCVWLENKLTGSDAADFLSCAIRLVITDSSVECLVLQHIGQALNGLAGPYAMSAGTTISSTFFPAQLRTISTSIFVIANMAGVSLSYLLGPIMVPADGSINDVRDYLWVAFIMASVCMVMIFIYLPDKPDDAPSISSTMKRTYNLEGFYKLALNKPFVLLAISYGIMTGVYAGWGPLYCLIMQKIPKKYC